MGQKTQKYFVVVKYPTARPSKSGLPSLSQQASYAVARPNVIKEVEASSPKAAAEAVGVPAGARAYVVLRSQVNVFARAETAPLEDVA